MAGPILNFEAVSLTSEQHDRFANFLSDEIRRAEFETSEFRENLILWREFVDPRPRTKSFPWPNASSVFVPIPRIVLDALKASVKQTITKQSRLFTAEIVSMEHAGIVADQEHPAIEAAVDFAEFISLSPAHLDLKRVLDEWIEEILVAGFGPVKVINDTVVMKAVTRGSGDETRDIVLHTGPRIEVVPVGTWVWPAGLWRSVQEMPWVGNWVELTRGALERRKDAPWNYLNVDETVGSGGATPQTGAPEQEARLEATGQMPTTETHRLYHAWLFYDPKADGVQHDLEVVYSLQANKLLKIRHNETGDGLKPFEVEVASPRSGTIMGRGIIEPIIQPVRAINTGINQTFDSQTLANAPSLIYPEESEAQRILAGGFFPGIPIPYKEEQNEIGILKFPDPSDTSFQTISFFMNIVERLTRIGPARLGEVSEGRRTPATLGLATQQIGAELIDELIDRIRDKMGRIIERSMILYHQTDPEIYVRALGVEKGTLLRRIVKRTIDNRRSVSEALRIRLFASSAVRSKELERQNAIATNQITLGWYQQMIQIAGLYVQAPPPVQPILLDIIKGSEIQMRRLVELADQPEAATIVPEISAQLAALTPQVPVGAAPGVPGATGATGASPFAGGGLPPELAAALGGLGGVGGAGGDGGGGGGQ